MLMLPPLRTPKTGNGNRVIEIVGQPWSESGTLQESLVTSMRNDA